MPNEQFLHQCDSVLPDTALADSTLSGKTKAKWEFRPFSRCEDSSRQESRLCLRCQRIDFGAIFDLDMSDDSPTCGHPVFDLGDSSTFVINQTCRLCCIFTMMIHPDHNSQEDVSAFSKRCHLRAMSSGWYEFLEGTTMDDSTMPAVVTLVPGEPSRGLLPSSIRPGFIQRGFLMPRTSKLHTRTTQLQPWKQPNLIDYSRVNDMLSACSRFHTECREHETDLPAFPTNARVIDCTSRKVVQLTPDLRFIALSYVWGDPMPETYRPPTVKSDPLPNGLPQTIEDAIHATRSLGMNYLWVDQFCIDQYDSPDKKHQIGQMANIYSHAYATIFALGDHANTGLSGVSRNRTPQTSIHLQDLTMFWSGPSIDQRLSLSKWKTRAWTLQECSLSRRCLFFDDREVVLVCHSDCTYEMLCTLFHERRSFKKDTAIYQEETNTRSPPLYGYLRQHIREYQSRHLTVPGDILDAFRGVLARFKSASYWGVPLFRWFMQDDPLLTPEVRLICGLGWMSTNVPVSLPNMDLRVPSWSWIGAPNILHYFSDSTEMSDGSLCPTTKAFVFQPTVEILKLDGTFVRLNELFVQLGTEGVISEQSQFLRVHSVLASWKSSEESLFAGHQTHVQMAICGEGRGVWCTNDWSCVFVPDQAISLTHGGITGFAVLLLIRKHNHARTMWLAIMQEADGSWRRQGLMFAGSMWDEEGHHPPYSEPPAGLLQTFLIG